ncbi:MAG: serine hydrolase domain-containing protein [Gemmatimonadota bacterium]
MRWRRSGGLMLGLVVVAALTWLVWAGSTDSTGGPTTGPSDPALERDLRRLVPFGFSGAVLVTEDGRTIHAGGYGFADRERGVPNTASTVFDIGSLSKQFTAAAIMALAERGRLSVDDSLPVHLPDVPADKRGITIHHLLTHTAGLPIFHDTAGDFQVMTREQAERAILDAELAFEPGDGWEYSNSGYTLLAAIVERVADRPFEDALRDLLFDPAGLERTGLYFDPRFRASPVAHGYRDATDTGSPLEWTETEELWALIGNGGVLSTAEDLARWGRALDTGVVLGADARERLFTRHVEVRQGLHSGYGWYVADEGGGGGGPADAGSVIRHGGANDFGFAARWRQHTDRDLLVVLLLNRQPPGMDVSIAADAVRQTAEATLFATNAVTAPPASAVARHSTIGRPSTNETRPPPDSPPPAAGDLERYAGTYRLPDDGGELRVRPSMDALAVEPHGPEAVRHLAFRGASPSTLEAVRGIDRRARTILDGITDGDYEPFARALADSSAFGFYRDYIADWWTGFEGNGGRREDVAVTGTVPIWWSPGDDRLATLIRAGLDGRAEVFRLHWREGRIVSLGGGAIRQPATTLFAPAGAAESSDAFVGYHLGIRRPVRLEFETDAAGRIVAMHIDGADGSAVRARKVTE